MTTLAAIFGRCREVGECLVWGGATNGDNLPIVRHGLRSAVSIPRLVLCLSKGRELDSIKGRVVWPTCGTACCVEPKHLRLGTKQAMWAWRQAEGLTAFTASHRAALTAASRNRSTTVLTMSKAREMRSMREQSKTPITELGQLFGCSADTAWKVINHESWREAVPNASVFHQRA